MSNFRIRVEVIESEVDDFSQEVIVEQNLGELRKDAIRRGKQALRAALALVWGKSVHAEFDETDAE